MFQHYIPAIDNAAEFLEELGAIYEDSPHVRPSVLREIEQVIDKLGDLRDELVRYSE
jgi:hypothetical protein